MAKTITVIGWALLVVGVALVTAGYIGVALSQGIWAALQLANPFNIANFAMTVLALAPGVVLITWGQRMRDRRKGQNASR